jgi:NAD(P)-dependent dehydrogenase (short-subunit alcohol dehydrogenase family)
MHAEVMELFGLTGKVALIIGGARHLGLDMASALAAAGSDVIITSRTLEHAEQSAEKLSEQYNVDALPLELDHTSSKHVTDVVSKAYGWKGRINVIINNAGGGGVSGRTRLLERDPQDIEALIKGNLIGTLYCCHEIGKIMVQQGFGKIINIASIAGILGRDRRMYKRCDMQGQSVDYAAAKAGVIGMTRDLAACLAPKGIYVNCISPGGFYGPARGVLPEKFVREYSDRTPLGRMGRDGIDIKGAALFLSSPASDYITGQNLVVDGGFTIWQ